MFNNARELIESTEKLNVAISLGRLLCDYQRDYNKMIVELDKGNDILLAYSNARNRLSRMISYRYLWSYLLKHDIDNKELIEKYFIYYDKMYWDAKNSLDVLTDKLEIKHRNIIFYQIIKSERDERRADFDKGVVDAFIPTDWMAGYMTNINLKYMINISDITLHDLLLLHV